MSGSARKGDARIAAGKRDFDARFGRARLLMQAQRWTDAMDELLEILMRDKAWSDDLARKTYIAILDVIEPPRPWPPEAREQEWDGLRLRLSDHAPVEALFELD